MVQLQQRTLRPDVKERLIPARSNTAWGRGTELNLCLQGVSAPREERKAEPTAVGCAHVQSLLARINTMTPTWIPEGAITAYYNFSIGL